jgi:hypothetical protein
MWHRLEDEARSLPNAWLMILPFQHAPTHLRNASMSLLTILVKSCIQSRQEEQEHLGDENGEDAYDAHEECIRILEANKGAYALEKQHVDEVAAGRESSEWNEETGEWSPIQEADYNAEEGPSS